MLANEPDDDLPVRLVDADPPQDPLGDVGSLVGVVDGAGHLADVVEHGGEDEEVRTRDVPDHPAG